MLKDNYIIQSILRKILIRGHLHDPEVDFKK
jgi:hypothetical protein